MNITAYKTHKIQPNENLFAILDAYLPPLEENSIVAVTSKIVGICEGRVVKKTAEDQKHELAKQEAEYYLPAEENHYGTMITITHNLLIGSAGIDESNGNNHLLLLPKNPQKSANDIREYLCKKNNRENIGVVITDSKISPLRWGVTGYSLCHSGFSALNSYIGKPDIYGHPMRMEQVNVADSLATAATLTMGEGNEQQPLAVITDLSFVSFQSRNPTEDELSLLSISLEADLYHKLLTEVPWYTKKSVRKG